MSMPPEASGPVFTVMRPTRIDPVCPRTMAGKPSAEAPSPAPVALMNRLRVNAMMRSSFVVVCLVRRAVGRVVLLRRLRAVEGLDFHAFHENAPDRGHACRIDVEELRAENLGGKADVGERRRVDVAEPA